MLTIHNGPGERFISLFELYLRLGRQPEKFHTWRRRNIYRNPTLEVNHDYHPTEKGYEEPDKKGRPRQDYLITIALAKAICINAGTIAGKNTKKFIESKEK